MKQIIRVYILLLVACICGSNSYGQSQITIKGGDSTISMAAVDTTVLAPDSTAIDTSKIKKTKPKLPLKPKKPKPLSKEFSGGFRLNSDGWSLFVDKGTVQSEEKFSDLFYDIKLMQLELTEKKHPKELKRSNGTPGGGPTGGGDKTKPYVYGKVNNFYGLKFGYGKRKMIAGKPDPGTISIHWVYLGGLSAGLEKPYYVKAFVREKGAIVEKDIKYTDTTKEYFLNNFDVIGGSGFSQGLGEIKIVPGIHAKTGLHFDFAGSRTTKLAVELGVNAELYMRSIAIMANQKARPYFMNVYASIQFGKRK
jgi:hypothetical protein